MLIIAVLSLLSFCIITARFTRLRIESAPFIVISTLILLLYFFAYFHALKFGAYFMLALGTISLLISSRILYKEKTRWLTEYITPGFVIPLGWLFVMCLFASTTKLSLWDEFTHWGPHIFTLYYNNALPSASDILIHKTYPPAGELFQYFFTFTHAFSLSNIYIAQTILIYAPLFVLFQRYTWKQWPSVFWLMLALYVLLKILHADMGPEKLLYMDTIVGIYWSAMVAHYFLSNRSPTQVIYLLPVTATLVLLKLDLMPFLLIATGLIGVDHYLHQKKYNWLALTLPLAGWLTLKSWGHYLVSIQSTPEWKVPISPFQMMHNFFLSHFNPTQQETLAHFIQKSLSHLTAPLILLALAFLFTLLLHPKKRKAIYITQLILLAGYIVYQIGLLILYLYVFQSYESVQLASYDRYSMIFLVGWLIIFIAQIATHLREKLLIIHPTQRIAITLTSIFFLLTLVGLQIHHRRSLEGKRGLWPLEAELKKISHETKRLTPPNAKLAIIWQNSRGLERAILLFQLLPRKINEDCLSYGQPYNPHDVWTCPLSSSDFLTKMGKMDYVLIAHADKNFWDHYQSLFPVKHTPIATYQVCSKPTFDSTNEPGCKTHTSSAYLYKVFRHRGKIIFQAITEGATNAS